MTNPLASITGARDSAATRPDSLAGRQGDFASVIARAQNRVQATPEDRQAAARESAEEFVAVTLVQPLLKQLRETSNAAAPFAPSSAELQFRGMMDAQIAQRVSRASNFPIVDVVARNLLRAGEKKTNESKEVTNEGISIQPAGEEGLPIRARDDHPDLRIGRDHRTHRP